MNNRHIMAGSLVALALLLVMVVVASRPGHGRILPSTALPASANTSTGSYVHWQGANVGFDLLSDYSKQNVLKPDGNAVEQYDWLRRGQMDTGASLDVVRLRAGKPQDEPSFLLRTSDPTTYKHTTLQLLGSPADVFSRDDQPERVLYVQRGDIMAVIGFHSSQGDGLDQQLQHAAATFAWTGAAK